MDVDIERYCCLNWEKNLGTPHWVFHFKEFMKLLFCQGDKPPLVWTPWTERRVNSVFLNTEAEKPITTNFTIWWGPSAVGKTTDAAAIILAYWFLRPQETTCLVCSTISDQLDKGIWGETVRLYGEHAPHMPFVVKPSNHSITLKADADTNIKDAQAGIFGVAVQRGSYEETKAALSGRHRPYVIRFVDEGQGQKEVVVESFENAKGGTTEAYFIMAGNPDSWLSVLGKHSIPKNGNVNSVSMDMDRWETKEGHVEFFNGLKSPGVEDPKKYPFLLSQGQIDDTRRTKGEDHPIFWQQRVGFVPPEGLLSVMMSEAFIMQHRMMEKAEWHGYYRTFAAVDPAFSSGGDDPVFNAFSVGLFMDGTYGIYFHEPIVMTIKAKKDKSSTFNLAMDIIANCKALGLHAKDLAMDTTGMQNMLADAVEDNWERGIYRCGFSSAISELPDDVDETVEAKKLYNRRVDQLWGCVAAFGKRGQIRGLSDTAAKQFAARLLIKQVPLQLEDKKSMKARSGYSPDFADVVAVAADYVREVLNFLAGGMDPMAKKRKNEEQSGLDREEAQYNMSDEDQIQQMSGEGMLNEFQEL